MTLLKKLTIGAAGLAAFVVAAALVSIISSMVSALMPGRSPDAPGKLDEPPEEKSRREYEATLNPKQESKSNESHTETDVQQEAAPAQEASSSQEATPAPSAAPAPPPVAPPAPPARGPGNFAAPPAPYGGGGIYPTGPGNM